MTPKEQLKMHQKYYHTAWTGISEELKSLLPENGFTLKGADIGNVHGEVYAYSDETTNETSSLYLMMIAPTQSGKLKIKLTFDDLAQLPKTEAFNYVGFSLVRNQEGHYVFYQASEPGPGFNPPDLTNELVTRQLTPILAGFKVVITLKTPGAILKTNADRRATFSSMWAFDFDRDPAALIKLQKHKLVTIFNSTGLDLPEIRVNNDDA